MSLDMTSFDAALKQHYTADMVENLVYADNPFLAMVPKYTRFGGRNLPLPTIYGSPQGRSATFATAQANKTNSQLVDFVLTRVSDYSLASISNEVIEASEGDGNAFMEAVTTEIDGAFRSATRSLASALYRSGSGSIGSMANSSFATTTLTLNEPDDIVNFEVGMTLVLSATDGGGSVRSGTLTIAGLDRDAGTITTSANISTGVAAAAQNDFIFVEGDYDSKVSGLAAWIPSSAPGATAFFGVDRSVDVTRLGGVRVDGSALPIEEALIKGAVRVGREGGRPDVALLNFDAFESLEKALGSKVQYMDVPRGGEIAFRGITINGPRGPIKVIPDHNCPADKVYMLQMNTWKLYSLKEPVRILAQDGNRFLRESSADAVEVRVGGYYQLGCRAPGYNGVISLA